MVAVIRQVRGLEGRTNDVLFVPAKTPPAHTASPGTVVFFGGDVQDFPEAMCQVRESRPYLTWSLGSTAKSLSHQFPLHHVLVVRAVRLEAHTVACYDNFVSSSSVGVPDHTPTYSALQHLERVLRDVTQRLKTMTAEELDKSLMEDTQVHHKDERRIDDPNSNQENGRVSASVPSCAHPEQKPNVEQRWWLKNLCLDRSRLTIIGFSKGCVVLNQLVYEFHYTKTLTPEDKEALRFMSNIDSMYWLDGGHAGSKNTWLTSRSLLETLARLDINIFVHVSPYQVEDDRRPWIGREERAFVSMLTKLGAKLEVDVSENESTLNRPRKRKDREAESEENEEGFTTVVRRKNKGYIQQSKRIIRSQSNSSNDMSLQEVDSNRHSEVKRYIHSASESGSSSLLMHFSVLTNFRRVQEDHAD